MRIRIHRVGGRGGGESRWGVLYGCGGGGGRGRGRLPREILVPNGMSTSATHGNKRRASFTNGQHGRPRKKQGTHLRAHQTTLRPDNAPLQDDNRMSCVIKQPSPFHRATPSTAYVRTPRAKKRHLTTTTTPTTQYPPLPPPPPPSPHTPLFKRPPTPLRTLDTHTHTTST